MKITSLVISPKHTWEAASRKNPLRAVVKLNSEDSTIECVLSDESMRKMLALCADEITQQAQERVAEFASAVSAIEGSKDAILLEGN